MLEQLRVLPQGAREVDLDQAGCDAVGADTLWHMFDRKIALPRLPPIDATIRKLPPPVSAIRGTAKLHSKSVRRHSYSFIKLAKLLRCMSLDPPTIGMPSKSRTWRCIS